jgi:hypothetical protein
LTASNCPPPDTGGGKVLGLPPNNTDSYTFYWVSPSSAGTPWQVSYGYTASNGMQGATTAYFNVAGPPAVTVGPYPAFGSQIQSGVVAVHPPPNDESTMYPSFSDGTAGINGGPIAPGISLFVQSTGGLPSGSQYQWVQTIQSDIEKTLCPNGVPETNFSLSGVLDTQYPYRASTIGGVPNAEVDDSPGNALLPIGGEVARSFNATMYLTWVPAPYTGCPGMNACTIPVPLGNFAWSWAGDAINTLDFNPDDIVTYAIWFLQASIPENGLVNPNQFLPSNSFPGWTGYIEYRTLTAGCQ